MTWMKPNLVARLADERAKVRGNVSQGWSSGPAQLAYITSIAFGGSPAMYAQPVNDVRSCINQGVPVPLSDEWMRKNAITTPDQLRAAFERAGVTRVEWTGNDFTGYDVRRSPVADWEFTDPSHRYRPGPGTLVAALEAFYTQWDLVEILDGAGNWLRRDTERKYSFDARRYRLPADAKLVSPL